MAIVFESLLLEGAMGGGIACRAKVPGGWLVYLWKWKDASGGGLFYPDPNHTWDGSSIPEKAK